MNTKNKLSPAPFESKTYTRRRKLENVRADDQTVFTLSLPKEMRERSRKASLAQGRPEAQLWRMAFEFAEAQGWGKVPIVM